MNPLLLLLLVGGGVLLLKKMKSGPELMYVRDGFIDSRIERFGVVVQNEKFRDPLYLCWGSKDKPYHIGHADEVDRTGIGIALYRPIDNGASEIGIGYEYLSSVPATAKDRVAAMRRKVDAFKASTKAGAGVESRGPIFQGIYAQSSSMIESFANTVVSSYKRLATSVTDATAFAKGVGVPVDAVMDEAKQIAALSGKVGDAAVLDEAIKKYGPIASTVAKSISVAVDIAVGGGSSTEAKAAAVLDLVAQAAMVIPGYGVLISAAASVVSSVLKDFAADKDAECQHSIDFIKDQVSKTLAEGMPVPWHLYESFNPNCDKGTPRHFALWCDQSFNHVTHDQISLLVINKVNNLFCHGQKGEGKFEDVCRDTLADAAGRFAGGYVWPSDSSKPKPVLVDIVDGGITPGYRQAMMRWWTLAKLYASHPKVAEVFTALGRDVTGGMIASDEQVMLVAAPYAAANGIAVDDFAEELYKRAVGWSRADGANFATLAVVSAAATDHDPIRQVRAAFSDYAYVKRGLPFNAWVLQWCTLAAKAEEIVVDWNKIRDERLMKALAKAKIDFTKNPLLILE